MASLNIHFDQALNNLHFLQNINENQPTEIRWQVTVAHYTALHLMHAYLADKRNHHPEDHYSLKAAISPSSIIAPVDKFVYEQYELLENMSRNARYDLSFVMTEKHLIKSINRLDVIMDFFKTNYPTFQIPAVNVSFNDDSYTKKKLKHINLLVVETVK